MAKVIGSRLASIATALPDVWNTQILFNESRDGIAEMVAKEANSSLKKFISNKNKEKPESTHPVTFLIMDRTADL